MPHRSQPRTLPLPLKIAVAVVVVIVLIAGIWATGALITNDFVVSMALTAAWMGWAAIVCALIAWRRRDLRIPVVGAYLLTAVVVGGYLTATTFFDREVNEDVAVASQPGNELLAKGPFEAAAHPAEGTASVIRSGSGRVLTLTDFEVDPGPDLRVYLVAGPARDEGEVDDFVDLGALKGNKGNQQYELPADADLSRYTTVVIWCRAFSVSFARAPLS